MDKYTPELGQMAFGQPWQEFQASELLIAALNSIREELSRVYQQEARVWNNNQEEIDDPFDNTGGKYENNTFFVESYSWKDDDTQRYNFKWKDFEVSWYKYLGRGSSTNREILPDEINTLLEECLKSLREQEVDNF